MRLFILFMQSCDRRDMWYSPPETLIDRVFQRFAGAEAGDFGSGDFDRIAGLRVAAGAGSALFHNKGTKAYQYYLFILLQRAGNGIDHRIQSTSR